MTLYGITQQVDKFTNVLIKRIEDYWVSLDEEDDDVERLIFGLSGKKISDIRTYVTDKWTEYGWVPILPTFQGKDILKNIIPPDTVEKADAILLKELTTETQEELFRVLTHYVKKSNHNEETLLEAILSYKNGFYSACSVLIFALIDACFLTRQPIKTGKRRELANGAAKNKIDVPDSLILSSAEITLKIVKTLFSNGRDFNLTNEKGLNRNFISHGMNRYNPDNKDCLKLFVLLFNIYLLFDTEVFAWK